jgi:tripartite ATP-independent transporter DctP family solute receptor
MLRNTLLGTVIVVMIALTSPAADAEQVLKLAHIAGADSPFAAAARVFAGEIVKQTGGKYRVQEFGNGTLGDDAALIEAVKLGTIDLVVSGLSGPLPKVAPELGVLVHPFVFDNEAHAVKVMDGPIGQSLLDGLRAKGVLGLAWGENGFRQLMTTDIPVREPADVKGVKIRVPKNDVIKAVWKALGAADVVETNLGDVYPALKSGRVNANENPMANAAGINLFDFEKTVIKLNYIYSPLVILMNPDAFDELTPEEKPIFIAAARAAGQASRDFVASVEKKLTDDLTAKGTVFINNPDLPAFREALKPLLTELGAKYGDLIERIAAAK